MERTTTSVSAPSFVADPRSVSRSTGRQVDWDAVPAAYTNAVTGKKNIPAGTAVDQIDASGKIVPRPAGANVAGQTTIGILVSNAIEGDKSAALSGYGVLTGGRIYTELLPSAPDATALTALRGLDGGGFAFETYEDDRAS